MTRTSQPARARSASAATARASVSRYISIQTLRRAPAIRSRIASGPASGSISERDRLAARGRGTAAGGASPQAASEVRSSSGRRRTEAGTPAYRPAPRTGCRLVTHVEDVRDRRGAAGVALPTLQRALALQLVPLATVPAAVAQSSCVPGLPVVVMMLPAANRFCAGWPPARSTQMPGARVEAERRRSASGCSCCRSWPPCRGRSARCRCPRRCRRCCLDSDALRAARRARCSASGTSSRRSTIMSRFGVAPRPRRR